MECINYILYVKRITALVSPGNLGDETALFAIPGLDKQKLNGLSLKGITKKLELFVADDSFDFGTLQTTSEIKLIEFTKASDAEISEAGHWTECLKTKKPDLWSEIFNICTSNALSEGAARWEAVQTIKAAGEIPASDFGDGGAAGMVNAANNARTADNTSVLPEIYEALKSIDSKIPEISQEETRNNELKSIDSKIPEISQEETRNNELKSIRGVANRYATARDKYGMSAGDIWELENPGFKWTGLNKELKESERGRIEQAISRGRKGLLME